MVVPSADDLINYGWAPGHYIGMKCSDCGASGWVGAKRSYRCSRCATNKWRQREITPRVKIDPDQEALKRVVSLLPDNPTDEDLTVSQADLRRILRMVGRGVRLS